MLTHFPPYTLVPFQDVRLPSIQLTRERSRLTPVSALKKTEAGKNKTLALSRDAARLLAQLHPMIVWNSGKTLECVGGLRTLILISPALRIGDQVPVAILPKSTPQAELVELLQADLLLTALAFAVDKPAAAVFAISQQIPKDLLASLSPALAAGVDTRAELLGVSPPTLYNLKRQAKKDTETQAEPSGQGSSRPPRGRPRKRSMT